MKNTAILTIVLFFLCFVTIRAQISEGGTPPSFQKKSNIRSASQLLDNPLHEVNINIDIERLIWEDEVVDKDGGGNRRFATIIPIENVGIDKSGIWISLDDSTTIWQQSLRAEGALGIIVGYKSFYIPKGAQLFIYNKDKTQILGSYTNKTNPKGGKFLTEIVYGDELTFEYVSSQISDEKPEIEIEDIGYIYNRKVLSRNTNANDPGIDKSEACMINVNCNDGLAWRMQKRGVVLILAKMIGGIYDNNERYDYCSGTLVNNTLQDKKPYILTASHCFPYNFTSPEESLFYFNYEYDECDSKKLNSNSRTLVGADILVLNPLNGNGDQTLLLLHNNIPNDYNPFFNGWDISNTSVYKGAVIHHPYGDVKKITMFNRSLQTATVHSSGGTGATNAHWRVVYDGRSVTQGGSSGSPIFNEYGLIVGTLSAGASSCASLLAPDYYGKTSFNWSQTATITNPDNSIAKFLDPNNSGTTVMPGFGIINGVEQTMDVTVGIEDENKWKTETKNLVLFPNPVLDQLNINSASIMKSISIYNMQGKIVYQNNDYNSSTLNLSLIMLEKGTYSISIKTEDNKIYRDKFLKN